MKNDEMSPTYKTMPGSSCPFSPEGLTVYEIEAFYREAKDKNEAVNILADCCDTYPANMARFLSERGLISGIKPLEFQGETERKRKAREKAEKVLELAEKGLTAREAAEELEIPLNTIRTIAARNKISFSGNAQKARKQKGETEMEKKVHIELPERDYRAEIKALQAENDELRAVIDELETMKKDYRVMVDKCERQTEENRWIRQKLEAVEAERDRLEGQMEVVQMIFGGGKNY